MYNMWDVKAVWGREEEHREGRRGREEGKASVNLSIYLFIYYFWSNNYGYSLRREGLRPKMLIAAFPTFFFSQKKNVLNIKKKKSTVFFSCGNSSFK